MKKNPITSILGVLSGIALYLHQTGVHIGHFGATDITGLLAAVGVAALGVYAKDGSNPQ